MTTPQQKVVTAERAWFAFMQTLSDGWLYKYDKARTAQYLLVQMMRRR